MLASRGPAPAVAWFSLLVLAAGCGGREAAENHRTESEPPPLSRDDQAVYQRLESEVNKIVSDESLRYLSLQYKYNENLLDIIDQIERLVTGKVPGDPPRFLPKLGAQEELDHFRETVRRWEAQTGKDLRAEVDTLKADVAARKPGEAFHPEFQRKFSRTFDSFVKIEVVELRERRNRAIHAAAEKLLAPNRDKHPEPVRRIETILNTPPYDLPSDGGSESSKSLPSR
jgi:hypothetical protein